MNNQIPPLSAAEELRQLLDYNQIRYQVAGGSYYMRFADGARQWETVITCAENTVLLYGIFPFPLKKSPVLWELLNEINGALICGSVFLQDGAIILRTEADVLDIYTAYETIARALEYNAAAVSKFWAKLQAAARQSVT